MGLLRRGRAGREGVTLFFATDLHGSEVCFRKFVAAASFYKADLLVLGGDLTGKTVTPIVSNGNGHAWVEQHGERRELRGDDVDDYERRAADEGVYTARMSAGEYEHFAGHPEAVDELFRDLMEARLARWVDHAKDRLSDTRVLVVTAPGNDDPYSVDDVIRDHGDDRVLLMEGQIMEVAPGHEMLSTGWSNLTPWHTHREFSETMLAQHIEEMAGRLESPRTAIFNIHVPPYDSRIDSAPDLDDNLQVRTSAGAQLTAPAGSTAVREAIEQHQPLLSLHGHIHESGGIVRIGRTVAINAGSEYGEGILHGVLLKVGGGELQRYQATTG